MTPLQPAPPAPEPVVDKVPAAEAARPPAREPRLKRWSFYRELDGLFISRRITANCGEAVKQNTPAGCVAIEGHFDRFSQRVDLATGEVIADESLGAQRDRERRRDATLQQIGELERRQLRPLRELAIDAGNVEAAKRLAEIEDSISALRREL